MQEITISSWIELDKILHEKLEIHKKFDLKMLHFRGQSDFSWNLTPSLARLVAGNDMSEKKAEFYEAQSKRLFSSQAHLLEEGFNYEENYMRDSILFDMQHYSCPTRLLDWSHSPFVALYFTVSESLGTDGALYIWDHNYHEKGLKKLHPDHVSLTGSNISSARNYDVVMSILPLKKNHRVVRQQGVFTISNTITKAHDEIMTETAQKAELESGLVKIKIPHKVKPELLSRLKTMNISAESLFPGLDGLGRSIKETLTIRKFDQY